MTSMNKTDNFLKDFNFQLHPKVRVTRNNQILTTRAAGFLRTLISRNNQILGKISSDDCSAKIQKVHYLLET